MSIKGVDAQIMIARANELTKEYSIQQKKTELTQDFLAIQARTLEEHDKKSVAKTEESPKVEISPDRESAKSGEEQKQSGNKPAQEKYDSQKDLDEQIGYAPRRIVDIEI